jgi:HEAT repeat protein
MAQRRMLMKLMISMCDFTLPWMSGEENKATLLELGAVEPLTKLLTHEDKIVRRNATMIFGILASNSKYQLLKIIS